MNFVKTKTVAIVVVFTLVAALMGASAIAQQPTPTPAAQTSKVAAQQAAATPLPLSVWDREGCDQLFAELARRRQMTADQLKGFTPPAEEFSRFKSCLHATNPHVPAPAPLPRNLQPDQSPFHGHAIELTPLPPPPSPSSSGDPPFGPFNPYPGADAAACSEGQPPNVSADVSSTQNVEFLNQGIWIFNKSGGAVISGSGQTTTIPYETQNTFWCPQGASQPLPLCGSIPLLSDTQIAWDPIDSVWIATALAYNQLNNTGYVYYAYTTTLSAADTSGNWLRWSLSACSGTSFPDEDSLGFSSDWIAIDMRCYSFSGPEITDTIAVMPHTDIANKSFNPQYPSLSSLPSNVYAWRPSRDVSGSNFGYLYLAASVVNGTSVPYALLSSIAPGTIAQVANPTPLPALLGNATDTYTLPLGGQGSCSQTSTCAVDTEDAAIERVLFQYNPGNSMHYLVTSFPAGIPPSGAEDLYYFLQVEDNSVYESKVGSTTSVLSYPTVAADQDLDFYATTTTFSPGTNIYSSWYYFQGWLNTVGQNYLQMSNGTYLGTSQCKNTAVQKWGALMSTIWDPSIVSTPSGEIGAFWTVQEFTQGMDDQSTEWIRLSDPLPFFVGYNVPTPPTGQGPAGGGENECPQGTGYYCNLTYSAPPGAQFGDVFVVVQDIGDIQDAAYLTVPTGWTKMTYVGGSYNLYANNGLGNTVSYYVALYVYGSQPNDTGQYEFQILPQVNLAETSGFLVAYRGAGTNIPGNYLLYGHAGTTNSLTVQTPTPSPGNNDSPPDETTLLNVFSTACVVGSPEDPDNDINTFGPPSGSPSATVETPLTSVDGFYAADVPVTTSGGTFGEYKSTVGCTYNGKGLNTGISLVIPEL